MRVMGDWLLALPLPWMTLVIFTAAYLVAAGVYLVVVGLAVNGLARVFKAFSPQMLTPLGVIFGLIVGFVALQTWNDFDKAKVAVDTAASALRVVVALDESLPEEQRIHLRTLINRHIINRHIDEPVNQEWPEMAQQRMTLAFPPNRPGRSPAGHALVEASRRDSTHGPAGDNGCIEKSFGYAVSAHRGRRPGASRTPANVDTRSSRTKSANYQQEAF